MSKPRVEHWLYGYVPRSWSEVQGHGPRGAWRLVMWALFGNEEDGLFGEGTGSWWKLYGPTPTFMLAVRWWLRNPAANLFKIVLQWRRPRMRVLYQWSALTGSAWWIEREQEKWLPPYDIPYPQITIALIPPGLAYRSILGLEGYALWHSDGWFGFAIRPAGAWTA